MTLLSAIAALALLLVPTCLRGDAFHNHLVDLSAELLLKSGLQAWPEHPLPLPDGRINFVDLLITGPFGSGVVFACEIETTTRYVLVNIEKAIALSLPVWIIVPNHQLKRAAQRKVKSSFAGHERGDICFLVPGQITQALTHCFPRCPAANVARENRKSNSHAPEVPKSRKTLPAPQERQPGPPPHTDLEHERINLW